MITRKEVLSALDHLPPLGTTFARLSALDKDHSAEIQDFVEVIESDPALAAGILGLANSAEFGLVRQVSTLSQAVAVLGTRRIIGVALAQAFRGVLPDTLPGYGIDSRMFWRHCIAAAVLSQSLAREFGLAGEDESFLAGLLHDIGKLVLGVYLAREKKEVTRSLWERNLLLVETERAVLGLDHCAVGLEVARKWDLPPGMAAVVRFHHAPSSLETDTAGIDESNFLQGIVDVVHMADCLAHEFGYGTDIGELSREIDPGVMKRTGVTPIPLEKVVSTAIQEIEERIQALDNGK